MDERARYPRRYLESLRDEGFESPLNGEWVDAPHWFHLRAYVERTGDLESEAITTVIDLERALTALQSHHRKAAIVIISVATLDLSVQDLQDVFGGRTNWHRLQTKGIAWMSAFLAGKPLEVCEHAYRRAR
ncbi:MAG: hypothetical protein WD739_07275 [Actinomycetota bacterium]